MREGVWWAVPRFLTPMPSANPDIPFGKRLPQADYFHRDGIGLLPPEVQERVHRAATLIGLHVDQFDVVKLHHDGARISLLSYPNFWTDGFPTLSQSWAVTTRGEPRVTYRDYREHWNPPVLHRKELLLPIDHPTRAKFAALTATAESRGLFDDSASIGQLLQWRETLRAKGLRVVGHQLEMGAASLDDADAEVLRHRTALRRSGLSTPMQALFRHGYLDGRWTVFDYGCGHGDDLATLEEMGLVASGWDPHFRPDGLREHADLVNLGFVLNVIEDLAERRDALSSAYALSRRVLAVGVLIGGRTAFEKYRLFRDGVLTARATFQKYFTQEELHLYLEEVCGRQPIPVGPGLAFVFRSDEDEQAFLAERQSSTSAWRLAIPRPPRLQRPVKEPRPTRERVSRIKKPNKWELNQPLLDRFYARCLELGRTPEPEEWSEFAELRSLGAAHTVLRRMLASNGDEEFKRRRAIRMDDILVYLALSLFGRRHSSSRLSRKTMHDIRAFWRSHNTASVRAKELLFSVGGADVLVAAARSSAARGIGYLGPEDELFFLPDQLPQLPRELRVFVGCATHLYGDIDEADLIKIHSRSRKLTVHLYDDFETALLPILIERVKIDLREQHLLFVDYASRENQQLLYFKSRYLPPDHPDKEPQQAFDFSLGALPFLDLSNFGPGRVELLSALAKHGLTLTPSGLAPL